MKPLAELVHPSWLPVLEPQSELLQQLGTFLRTELRQGFTYQPAGENILKAFSIPMSSVKVLILGQDPYPTAGHAMGLSFSVAAETKPLPKSLQNIFAEMTSDLQLPAPSAGDLTPWFEQGVLLLNRVMTVRTGSAGSHRGKGWEKFTEAAISGLANQPFVAVLWGNDAAQVQPLLKNQPVIQSSHPSPLSAHRGFRGSRPFSSVNSELRKLGLAEIDWSLP